ncbi:LysR family transcriptional regulator [Endozoicomonas ascidiicola]|uniref:LysR family transcriptional regulator n=1 Tax=Endozoicomonas ascidiicola TaxID=1698521 RepID=UPI000836F5CE|nr:LysR family transcriptional regulator [Endozoicomonas ascidiicola]
MNRLLKHFKVVAHHKKIASACRELNISQPALSKSIKTLEDSFGLPLFERLPRGMELTEAGVRLLNRIRRMDMEYQYAVEEINLLRSGKGCKLFIGAGTVWERYLPPVISQLYDEYPNLEVIIRADTNEQLMPDLVEGKLDVVLGGGNDQIGTREQLAFLPLLNVNMKIAAHRSHPLASMSSVTAEQLAEYPWVAYQRSKGAFLNQLFDRKGIKSVRYSLQTELLDVALDVMEKRQALLCIAEQFFYKLPENDVVQIHLNEAIWNFHSGIWYQSSARYTPVVDRFIDLLTQEVERLEQTPAY